MVSFVSLFSGAGGFDIGFDRAGFRCLAQVEIDPTARAVLARHWPDVPRYEDVREFGAKQVPHADVVVGGFPCQDLSVAGNRKGITGARSGLFYELVRIACELRSRFLVLENVPGLISSFTGEELPTDAVEGSEREVDEDSDFETVLSHLAECGFHGGWRSLDARHFGVPQSRRRVFGCFTRDRADAERCAEILALQDRVRRDSPKGGQAGAHIARSLTAGTGSQGYRVGADEAPNLIAFGQTGDFADYQKAEVAGPLRNAGCSRDGTTNLAVFGGNDTRGERGVAAALSASQTRQDFETQNLVACLSGDGFPKGREDGVSFTLKARAGRGHGDGMAVFQANDYAEGTYEPTDEARPLTTSADRSRAAPIVCRTAQTSANGIGVQDDAAYTLDVANAQAVCVTGSVTHTLTSEGADASEDGTGRGTPIVCHESGQGWWNESETSGPLRAEGENRPSRPTHTVVEPVSVAQNQRGELRTSATAPAVTCGGGKPGEGYPAAMVAGLVRRLTPLECERLMGWPDSWTQFRADGTEIADGPRYRLCGNGVVGSVSEWLARRMMAVFAHEQHREAA